MSAIVIEVPPVNTRERIPTAAIEDVVNQIATRFHPQQIILFGSYAYGNPRPDSDVDILVIMETQMSGVQQTIRILKSINYLFGLDLLVYTPENLAHRIAIGDPFIKEITQRGKVVYASPGD